MNLQKVSVSLLLNASRKQPDLSSWSPCREFQDCICNKNIFMADGETELCFLRCSDNREMQFPAGSPSWGWPSPWVCAPAVGESRELDGDQCTVAEDAGPAVRAHPTLNPLFLEGESITLKQPSPSSAQREAPVSLGWKVHYSWSKSLGTTLNFSLLGFLQLYEVIRASAL